MDLHCPTCRKLLDACVLAQEAPQEVSAPVPGDITVCAYCETVCVFAPAGLELALPADLVHVPEPFRPKLLRLIAKRVQ
jgi:hypothetical protein